MAFHRALQRDVAAKKSIDGLTTAFVTKLFGRYNKAVEKAFEAKGLKPDNVRKAMTYILKSQSEFILGMIKTAISETTKEKTKKE